jgi:hypothetical protein
MKENHYIDLRTLLLELKDFKMDNKSLKLNSDVITNLGKDGKLYGYHPSSLSPEGIFELWEVLIDPKLFSDKFYINEFGLLENLTGDDNLSYVDIAMESKCALRWMISLLSQFGFNITMRKRSNHESK